MTKRKVTIKLSDFTYNEIKRSSIKLNHKFLPNMKTLPIVPLKWNNQIGGKSYTISALNGNNGSRDKSIVTFNLSKKI